MAAVGRVCYAGVNSGFLRTLGELGKVLPREAAEATARKLWTTCGAFGKPTENEWRTSTELCEQVEKQCSLLHTICRLCEPSWLERVVSWAHRLNMFH